MINRYSLADHVVQIKLPGTPVDLGGLGGRTLRIGGPGEGNGSFIGSITVTRTNATWTTAGDVTGSWVHNKSLDKTGTVALSINQVSDDVTRLIMVATAYENDLKFMPGCLIQVFGGDVCVATAQDCYIAQIPDQVKDAAAGMQNWIWTAGKTTFDVTTEWSE